MTAKIAPLGSELAPQMPDRLGVPRVRWILDMARIFSNALFQSGGGTIVCVGTPASAG